MKKIFALLTTLSFLLSASIVFADESAPVMKKTGTENAMMKGKGKKLGLKKKAVKKMKKMKKMKKKGMKKMEKMNGGSSTSGSGTGADGATGTDAGSAAGTGTGFSSGSGSGTEIVPSAIAQIVSVNIQNFSFATPTVNVKVGDTVKWINLDSVAHTVESDDGMTFKSSILVANESFSKTFTAAGTFPYHCGLHPSMTGVVVIE